MKGIFTCFIWVPAHVGGKGNEQVDILAKQALKVLHVDLQVPLSKAEVKSFIRTYAQNTWQEHWGMSETGRHLYSIQRHVGDRRKVGFKRRDESIITRLRIGHTGLNYSLHKIGKHPTGKCQHCYQPETVEHVLVNCSEYNAQRDHLFQTLSKAEHTNFSLSGLLGKTAGNAYHSIIKFLREIGVVERI